MTKTEIVPLTKKRIAPEQPMRIGGMTIQTSKTVKYLGVILDSRIIFGDKF